MRLKYEPFSEPLHISAKQGRTFSFASGRRSVRQATSNPLSSSSLILSSIELKNLRALNTSPYKSLRALNKQKFTSLKYEPSSEPLHISAKQGRRSLRQVPSFKPYIFDPPLWAGGWIDTRGSPASLFRALFPKLDLIPSSASVVLTNFSLVDVSGLRFKFVNSDPGPF